MDTCSPRAFIFNFLQSHVELQECVDERSEEGVQGFKRGRRGRAVNSRAKLGRTSLAVGEIMPPDISVEPVGRIREHVDTVFKELGVGTVKSRTVYNISVLPESSSRGTHPHDFHDGSGAEVVLCHVNLAGESLESGKDTDCAEVVDPHRAHLAFDDCKSPFVDVGRHEWATHSKGEGG